MKYAGHYLRLGKFRMKYPLLDIRNGKVCHVSLFTEEAENTIFINGTILLKHNDFLSFDEDELQDVDLNFLRQIINNRKVELVL